MTTAERSLDRLREGNRRFVSGDRHLDRLVAKYDEPGRQEPFAAILGCADSRVPVEIVFDQGPGDLFVIRVAGNIVAPSQIDSVEFAVEKLGTRLVVVLGHTGCGAVQATLEHLQAGGNASPGFTSIVKRILPAVEGLLKGEGARDDPRALAARAVRANVRVAADHLRHGSKALEDRVAGGDVLIVGAEYSLETGVVDFFDGVSA